MPRATVPSLSTCDGRTTDTVTLARGVVQATGQTMRHVSLPVVMWFVITFLS